MTNVQAELDNPDRIATSRACQHHDHAPEDCPQSPCFQSGFDSGYEHGKQETELANKDKRGRASASGKGSRLRKYQCGHGQIIRAATDSLDASCNVCGSPFGLCATASETEAEVEVGAE